MRPSNTNAHFACVPGRPISAPCGSCSSAASLGERAEDLRFFAAHHVGHRAAPAARPARCAPSTPFAAFTVDDAVHERIGASAGVSTYGASTQPCALPTMPAAITGSARMRASSHAPQVSSNAWSKPPAGRIHDPRRRRARIQHRAVGAEQIGAQRQSCPSRARRARRRGCGDRVGHRLILRVVGCGTRQPSSSEIARASRCTTGISSSMRSCGM